MGLSTDTWSSCTHTTLAVLGASVISEKTTAKQILVSVKVPLPRKSVGTLLETIREVFQTNKTSRVERILYQRGEDNLVVERMVAVSAETAEAPKPTGILTPYQMIRQHTDIAILEPGGPPLKTVARAAQQLSEDGYYLTMFVTRDKRTVRKWLGSELQVDLVWKAPLLEDQDITQDGLFVVGSATGTMIGDIQGAVFCRIGD